MQAVAKLIAAYVRDLNFSQNKNGEYNTSPYDQFLKKNHLPRKPRADESPKQYSQRLASAIAKLESPKFIVAEEGKFVSHKQQFVFSKAELQGMKLFFRKGGAETSGGNCVACHTPPDFSDYGFHNTGLTQINYDEAHGMGQFARLDIPNLKRRNENYNQYLPPSAIHAGASGKYRTLTDRDQPGHTDLGLWNVFANPDMPAPQAKLTKIVCNQQQAHGNDKCDQEYLLPFTIAAFKTPVIRDLGHSNPYMHTGQFTNLKEAIGFYVQSSRLAKAGKLRKAAPQLNHIKLTVKDIDALTAFVKSLNEDYE
jgi:cytochrome c peroxidase